MQTSETDTTMSTVIKPRRQRLPRLARQAFGIPELAAAYGNSESHWRLEIARGRLKTIHIGRRVLVTAESLEEYLNG
jgi:hypothetical protein